MCVLALAVSGDRSERPYELIKSVQATGAQATKDAVEVDPRLARSHVRRAKCPPSMERLVGPACRLKRPCLPLASRCTKAPRVVRADPRCPALVSAGE